MDHTKRSLKTGDHFMQVTNTGKLFDGMVTQDSMSLYTGGH